MRKKIIATIGLLWISSISYAELTIDVDAVGGMYLGWSGNQVGFDIWPVGGVDCDGESRDYFTLLSGDSDTAFSNYTMILNALKDQLSITIDESKLVYYDNAPPDQIDDMGFVITYPATIVRCSFTVNEDNKLKIYH